METERGCFKFSLCESRSVALFCGLRGLLVNAAKCCNCLQTKKRFTRECGFEGLFLYVSLQTLEFLDLSRVFHTISPIIEQPLVVPLQSVENVEQPVENICPACGNCVEYVGKITGKDKNCKKIEKSSISESRAKILGAIVPSLPGDVTL